MRFEEVECMYNNYIIIKNRKYDTKTLRDAYVIKFDPRTVKLEILEFVHNYLIEKNFYTTPMRFKRAIEMIINGNVAIAQPNPRYRGYTRYKVISQTMADYYNVYIKVENGLLTEGLCECLDYMCMYADLSTLPQTVAMKCNRLKKYILEEYNKYKFERTPKPPVTNVRYCKHIVASYILYLHGFFSYNLVDVYMKQCEKAMTGIKL